MSVAFPSGLTIRSMFWSSLINWANEINAKIQYDDDGTGHYHIWFYDGPEVYECTIWKNDVPDTVLSVYSQEQNDADKDDFEDNYKTAANACLEPKTEDGRIIQMPQVFEEGVFLYVPGAADHPTLGRGAGDPFRMQRSTDGDELFEWSFNDWVKMVGGSARYFGGVYGDEVSFSTIAPATEVEEVTPGTGSVILYDTGAGFNAIIPYPGGTHNIVADSEVPVPVSVGETGYWNWSCPDFGKGTVSAMTNGPYNLYDEDIPLSRHVARMQLIGDGMVEIGTNGVKPLIALPHWVFQVVLHNEGGEHTVKICWELKLSRKRTTQEF